jgi:hypothetical protein
MRDDKRRNHTGPRTTCQTSQNGLTRRLPHPSGKYRQPNTIQAPLHQLTRTEHAPLQSAECSIAGSITARPAWSLRSHGPRLPADQRLHRMPASPTDPVQSGRSGGRLRDQPPVPVRDQQLDLRLPDGSAYLADCRRELAAAPFYWRQRTWMLVDSVRRAVPSRGVDHSASA